MMHSTREAGIGFLLRENRGIVVPGGGADGGAIALSLWFAEGPNRHRLPASGSRQLSHGRPIRLD